MTTQPLGPPPILDTDPGPWSVISSTFIVGGGPGRRRQPPPIGLMLSPAPEWVENAGLDHSSAVAGVGRLRILAAAREPAFILRFDGDDVLRGASPHVARAWSVPDLALQEEVRPGDDPAADAPEPVPVTALDEPELPGAIQAPGGEYVALYCREPRADVLAILRASDRAAVRWIRGARAAAWSTDGRRFAVGGTWGVLLGETEN